MLEAVADSFSTRVYSAAEVHPSWLCEDEYQNTGSHGKHPKNSLCECSGAQLQPGRAGTLKGRAPPGCIHGQVVPEEAGRPHCELHRVVELPALITPASRTHTSTALIRSLDTIARPMVIRSGWTLLQKRPSFKGAFTAAH